MTPARSIRRVALASAACLMSGAVATVLVAWGFTLFSLVKPSHRIPAKAWPCAVPADWGKPKFAYRYDGPGLLVDEVMSTVTTPPDRMWVLNVCDTRAGWPWPALRSQSLEDGRRPTTELPLGLWREGLRAPASLAKMDRALAIAPVMPGFIADSVLYAATPAAGLLLARGVRRALRNRRGLCLACGYDLSGLPPGAACPECGKGAA